MVFMRLQQLYCIHNLCFLPRKLWLFMDCVAVERLTGLGDAEVMETVHGDATTRSSSYGN